MSNNIDDKKGYIFGSIFALSNRLETAGNKLFKEITVKQWFMLASIHHSEKECPTLSEVSHIMGYSRQNVKKIALHLEKKGFILFKKDENDGRILRITQTELCSKYLKSREATENDFLNTLFSNLSSNEITLLCDLMRKLERGTNNL